MPFCVRLGEFASLYVVVSHGVAKHQKILINNNLLKTNYISYVVI